MIIASKEGTVRIYNWRGLLGVREDFHKKVMVQLVNLESELNRGAGEHVQSEQPM